MLDRMPLYVVSFSHVEPRPRRLTRLMVKVFFPGLFSLLIGGFLASCSTISGYNQTAYEHVTDIKVDTLVVMGKATDSYPQGALLGGFLLGMTATQYLWIIRSKASWPS